MAQLDPIQRCLSYPPLPGSNGSFSLELQVTETIRIGDCHNSQVVMVEVLTDDPPVEGLSRGQCVVAKLYDPMYIDHDGFRLNPFLVVDKEYTSETAAYTALSDFQGSAIPRYYGSYSLDIPLEGTDDKRIVRLILMDFIPGLPMKKAGPHNFPQDARQNMLKSLIEFESLVFVRDILLADLHPRNILLTDSGDATLRLVFLDFGNARFGRLGYYSHLQDRVSSYSPGEYISPLLRWHKVARNPYYYRDWIDWKWQPWLETEFADTEANIKPAMREKYLPAFLFQAMDLPDYSVD